jgi:hypothetical protein
MTRSSRLKAPKDLYTVGTNIESIMLKRKLPKKQPSASIGVIPNRYIKPLINKKVQIKNLNLDKRSLSPRKQNNSRTFKKPTPPGLLIKQPVY